VSQLGCIRSSDFCPEDYGLGKTDIGSPGDIGNCSARAKIESNTVKRQRERLRQRFGNSNRSRVLTDQREANPGRRVPRVGLMIKLGIVFGTLAIIALLGAVAVTSGYRGFSFSPTGTRFIVDRSETRATSAAASRQAEVKQPGAIEPVPARPAPRAPVSNESTSYAKTSPVLDKTGSATSAREVLVPDPENSARRTALTADEKEAVARGLKELGIGTANAMPSSQSEWTATPEFNRDAPADSVTEEARSKRLQAQNQQ
jgi:hypothetical protein